MRGEIGIHVEQCRPSTVVGARRASLILAASLLLTGFLASSSVIISGGIRRVGRVGSSWNGTASSSEDLHVLTSLMVVNTPAFCWGRSLRDALHCAV